MTVSVVDLKQTTSPAPGIVAEILLPASCKRLERKARPGAKKRKPVMTKDIKFPVIIANVKPA